MSDENQDIQKDVSEQSGIPGQRKEVNVENYPEAISLGQLLKDINFPASKEQIIKHVEQSAVNDSQGRNILVKLQGLEDKQYQNTAEVTKALGVVRT